MDSTPSSFSRYATKDALVYYLLSLPAFAAETMFALAITSAPGGLASQVGAEGVLAQVAQLFPWLMLVLSICAVLVFRPSILVTLLVASFFLAASVTDTVAFLGAQLGLAETVFLVIASSFLALAGFNYARGLKLRGGREPKVTSSGAVGFQVVGVALESILPFAVALGLVALIEAVVAALGAQAARLPAPLSTIASLYLQARVGSVFTALFVAGAAIWVMRQSIEPVILHYTLNASDARKELLAEIEPTTKAVKKIARYRPSGGLSWSVMTVACCAALVAALAYILPIGQLSRDLLAALTLQAPPPTPLEAQFQHSVQNALVRADILYAQSQDVIREVITLLWG